MVGLRVEEEKLGAFLTTTAQLKEISVVQQVIKDAPGTTVHWLLALHRPQASPLVVAELLDQGVLDLTPGPRRRLLALLALGARTVTLREQ